MIHEATASLWVLRDIFASGHWSLTYCSTAKLGYLCIWMLISYFFDNEKFTNVVWFLCNVILLRSFRDVSAVARLQESEVSNYFPVQKQNHFQVGSSEVRALSYFVQYSVRSKKLPPSRKWAVFMLFLSHRYCEFVLFFEAEQKTRAASTTITRFIQECVLSHSKAHSCCSQMLLSS